MSATFALPRGGASTQDPDFADTEILEREDAPKPRPMMGERLGFFSPREKGRSLLRLPRWLPDMRAVMRWVFINRVLALKLWCIVGAVLTVPLLVWFWGLFGSPEVVQQTILGQVRVPATPGWGELLAHRWWGWLVYAFLIPVLVLSAPTLLLWLPILPVVLLLWMVFGPIATVMVSLAFPLVFLMKGPQKLIEGVSLLLTLGDKATADIQRFNDMLGLSGVSRGVLGEPRLMDGPEFKAYCESERKGEPFGIGTFDGEPFEVRTDKHVLLMAPTRAGKNWGFIEPCLKTYPGSVLTLDPKGENALLTAELRKAFGPVYVLDPMGITGLPSARYNPLASMKGINLTSAAQTLAGALIIGDDGDHWTSAAETLLAGVIAYVCTAPLAGPEEPPAAVAEEDKAKGEGSAAPAAEEPPEAAAETKPAPKKRGRPRKTPEGEGAATVEKPAKEEKKPEPPKPPRITARDLPTVRRIIMRELPGTLLHMVECPDVPELCRDVGAWGMASSEDEWSGIVSTVVEQTKWLAAPQMAESLSDGGEQVDFELFKTVVQSVYVCLPAPDFPVYSRWLRLIVAGSLDTLTKRLNPAMPYPVRFVLDELAQLGTLSKVESALTLSAGYGVQLWGVWQHLKDIERCYPRSGVSGWVSCSGARLVFGASDNATCNYFAEMSGVLKPQQLRLLPEDSMLAMFDGLNPSIVTRGVVVKEPEEGAAT